jgi:hypothetical protein
MGNDQSEGQTGGGLTPEESAREFINQGGFIVEVRRKPRVATRIVLAVAGLIVAIAVVVAVLVLTGTTANSPAPKVRQDPPSLPTTSIAPPTTQPSVPSTTASTTTTTVKSTTASTTKTTTVTASS